jgi:hypothetical protein
MLYVTNDEDGLPIYMVTNNQGLCLIRTTDGYIATVINSLTKNINPNLRINVGGDPGTRNNKPPRIFHHVRRYRH